MRKAKEWLECVLVKTNEVSANEFTEQASVKKEIDKCRKEAG